MDDKLTLAEAVAKRAIDSDGKMKLTCAAAFELAEKFAVEVVEVGRVCNQQDIKICRCQLGCFK